MKLAGHRMGAGALALWLLSTATAPAPESIERNPVYRSNSSNYCNLGSAAYPFATNFTEHLVLNGADAGVVLQGVTNALATVTNALGVFLATGEMDFDGGAITSDGRGDILMGGNLYTTTNATEVYYLGADPANPGISATAWQQGVESSEFALTPSGLAVTCRPNLNDSPEYSILYMDDTGEVALSGDNNLNGLWFFGDGTGYLIDSSGLGLRFNGTGSPSFDASVSFVAGAAEIQPDTAGNGGATLMLNAQDNGQPMYLHVDSSGSLTITTSP